jgi:PhnB protein
MSKASSHVPAGFHTLIVHLTVNGAAEYIEFLKRAFDAIELTRSPAADGRLLNASVRVGDSVILLNVGCGDPLPRHEIVLRGGQQPKAGD